MTTTARRHGAPGRHTSTQGRRSLLRAELRRLASRTLVRVTLAVGLVVFAGAVVVAFTQFGPTTPQVLAEAEERIADEVALSEQFRQECLDGTLPEGVDPEQYCGPPMTEQNLDLTWFIDPPPFVLAEQGPAGATAVGVGVAVLLFLVGATAIGAEWSSRSLVALLFWEPRRGRVLAVKAAVLAVCAAAVALVFQALWLGASHLLASTRGTTDVGDAFYPDLLGVQARSVLLAVVVAVLAFGLAHLTRNTGAALGIGFVYFAVVESVVGALLPAGREWLATVNALALLQHGGMTIQVPENVVVDPMGGMSMSFREIVVGNVQGGLVLAAYCAVVLLVGYLRFRRSDLH